MPETNVNTPIASAYARSLLELANEQGQAEPIGAELASVRQLLAENPSLGDFLSNPAVGETERTGLIDKIFRGQASQLLMNFLGVVGAKGRLGLLGAIAQQYQELLDRQLGKLEVDVTVARELSPEQQEQLRGRIGGALGKTVIVRQRVDESIIGGMVLRVQDQLIDASVKTQIDSLRRRILAARTQVKHQELKRAEAGGGSPRRATTANRRRKTSWP